MSKITSYARFLSKTSNARKPSAIRELYPFMSIPGMISLGGGMPQAKLFPYQSMKIQLKDGKEISIESSELDKALQYTSSFGLPSLIEELKNLQHIEHKKDLDDNSWNIIVGTGSQDLLEKTFFTLLDKESTLLLENPTYSGALAGLAGIGCNFETIPLDQDGLKVDVLDSILNKWDNSKRAKPKVLYCIPTGQNPSGATLSLERRQSLLKIAEQHDLLILEDDPYYFLQFEEKPLPSLYQLDKNGRVLRFDSFSKVLSAGLRVGFCTGPTELIEKIQLHMQASSLCCSGISQTIVATTMKEWGRDGWLKHVKFICEEYKRRRDVLIECCEKHLTGLAEWSEPKAGMFLWIKFSGVKNAKPLIMTGAAEKKFLMVPGQGFYANNEVSSYVRAAYSIASDEEMNEAIKRLAELLKEHK